MSTKAKKAKTGKAAPEKSPAEKSSKDEGKHEKKKAAGAKAAAKGADDDSEMPTEGEGQPAQVDPDELEEQEDAAAAAGSGGGESAAIAAANSSEMSASFKNFRHHPDMENFYRFIYENDLRHEALAIIDQVLIDKRTRKTAQKIGKPSAH